MSATVTSAIYPVGRIARSSIWHGTNPFVLHRIERNAIQPGRDGAPYLAADFSAITYTVTEMRRGREFIVAGYSDLGLTPSAVVFDQLQGWPDDNRGYNFKHMIPLLALPDAGAKYRIDHKFTLAADGTIIKWPSFISASGPASAAGTSDAGSSAGSSPILFSSTAIVPVNNTAAETTGIGAGVGSMTIAANSQAAGDVFDFYAEGFYSTDAVIEPTLTWRFKIAADLTLSVALQLPAAQTEQTWIVEGKVRRSSLGATGTVTAAMHALVMTAGEAIFGSARTTAQTAIDTTVSKLADFTLQWGTADVDNKASVIGFDFLKHKVAV